MDPIKVTHVIRVPDELRLARSQRAPELGPRILFFTGGTAMRGLSRKLKLYTHNTTHLITPFDSGGSSAKLREAFDMLSVGDIRNRLIALADETLRGNPQTYALFAHRFDPDADPASLGQALEDLTEGAHELIAAVPEPIQRIALNYIRRFRDEMPDDFDLRGASIGNLLLAGGYLDNNRDLDALIFLVSKMIAVLGTVCPVTDASLHLSAELEDGTRLVGQDRITGKEHPPIESPISNLSLVDSLTQPEVTTIDIPDKVLELIHEAELICFPMGSFWTSLIANLLPRGVGRAIRSARCPKIYIPNVGHDPEQLGLEIHDCIEILHRRVCEDCGESVPMDRVLDFVLIDSKNADYAARLDTARIEALGIQVIDVQLVTDQSRPLLDSSRLAQTLVSMA